MVDDQTAYLQGLIDQTPNGTVNNPSEVTLPRGRFRTEGTLRVSRRQWLVIDAIGTTFYRLDRGTPSQASNERHILIAGSEHITWLVGRVEGAHVEYDSVGIKGKYLTDYEAQHGIVISPIGSTGSNFTPCIDITVDGFSARDIAGDYIYISGALVGPQGNRFYVMPEDITIRNVLGEKNGRQGIGCVGVRGLLVEDCTLIAKRTAIDLENVSQLSAIEDVMIRRNLCMGDNGMVNAQSSHPIVNNVTIEDNVYLGGGGLRCTGTVKRHRHDWIFRRNVFPGPASYSATEEGSKVWFQYTDHVQVVENYVRIGLKRTHNRDLNGAVRLCDTDDVAISDNDFRGHNQLILTPGVCQDLNTVTSGNVGVWEGPISTFQPYPSQYDPNVDRSWSPKDFPQLYPTPFSTEGHWDNLPRGSGLGSTDMTVPLKVSFGHTSASVNTTGTVDTAITFPVTADHLYLAFVAASRDNGISGNVVIPASHGGLNWVLEKSLWIGVARRIHLFRAMSTSDLTSGSISPTTTETATGLWWTVLDLSGVYSTGDSADTIRQVGIKTSAGSTSIEVPFPFSPLGGNAEIGFCMHGVSEPQQIDPGHTLLYEAPLGGGAGGGGQQAGVDWSRGDQIFRWDWASTIHALALTVEVQADTPVGGAGYPQVLSVTETVFKTNTTVHQVALPTVDPGELLLLVAAFDGGPTATNPAGWVEQENVANVNHRRLITARVADGTEGAIVNVATSTTEAGAAQVYRIGSWWGALDGLAVGPVNASGAVASNDVPSLAPPWSVEKTLWIAALTVASPSVGINVAYPVGWVNGVETDPSFGSSGAIVASARREAAAPSQNPGPFVMNVPPSGSASRLIAIRPAG